MYVFHIGLGKTGTTTLQGLMTKNVEALAKQGIIFPVLGGGRPRAHHDLQLALRRDGEGITAPVWEELRALIDQARERTVLVTAEGFSSRSIDPRLVREGIDRSKARVIVYVRDLLAWVVSMYSQGAKGGRFLASFDETLSQNSYLSTRYADLILPWAEAFGHNNVRIRSLEPDCLVNRDLIDDFLSTLGTTREGLVIPPNANESPDWRVVELLRARFAQYFSETGTQWELSSRPRARIRKAGLAAGERLGWRQRAEYITREQRRLLAARYRSDREHLLELIPDSRISDIEFDLDRERPFLPCPEEVPEVDRRAFEEVFEEILAKQQADNVLATVSKRRAGAAMMLRFSGLRWRW